MSSPSLSCMGTWINRFLPTQSVTHPLLAQVGPVVLERQQVLLVVLDKLPLRGLPEVSSRQRERERERGREDGERACRTVVPGTRGHKWRYVEWSPTPYVDAATCATAVQRPLLFRFRSATRPMSGCIGHCGVGSHPADKRLFDPHTHRA